jgi:hypothetical protein
MTLYCEAGVLRVLLTQNEQDSNYNDLVQEFEKLIFPHGPTSEGMTKLKAVKSAMIDLDRLIVEKNGELSWALNWFAGIGHDETNPATLVMLVRLIALNTESLRDCIREIGPLPM